ncbi:hypothetical protein DTO96_102210 [Ephemeroptericola cinctiostellae]|uniref:Thiol-disulfide oxidoreductase DCC n=1 Tax=Ephemeroptericola cinctiostellae TaxID=2268024 RepID=A0A345DDL8_9BURK|nr:DUF393 domain-containing protein [Ephemeroptericola cinctiostellae]AXF86456.1 hypothetical protein DTO96_102210 [Ephemeroptericola cinctiostellae]
MVGVDYFFPLTIFYDAHCTYCVAEKTFLLSKDQQVRLLFVDCASADFSPEMHGLNGLTQKDLLAAIYARSADGQVFSGLAVFRWAYRAVGYGRVWAWTQWPLIKPCMDGVYRLFARYRHLLPQAPALWVVRWLKRRDVEQVAEAALLRSRMCRDGQCEWRATDREK